jgi:glycosyltransferase involved in cell wall biosynthesis
METLMRPQQRVALVHDWLVTYRGGEKVLEALCRLYPEAPIYTLFHEPGSQPLSIEQHPIIESVLARIPGARRRHRLFLPLFPFAIERFDLQAYDLVISTSHAVAKGVLTRADALHISYVHTPMRYVWEKESDYLAHASPLTKAAFVMLAPFLRLWDESSERRVDHFVANAKTVARRIWKRYRRQSHVIHPPVDTASFSAASTVPGKDAPYLAVSALVPYKRIDLLLEAFAQDCTRKLVIVGEGPERKRLERHAPSNVTFLGFQDGARLAELYRTSQALLFPGEEDFGITPIEMMASGRPVVAYSRGGATETVIPLHRAEGEGQSPTGVWFDEQTPRSLLQALELLEANTDAFDPQSIVAWARTFDGARFAEEMKAYIELASREHQKGPRQEHFKRATVTRLPTRQK